MPKMSLRAPTPKFGKQVPRARQQGNDAQQICSHAVTWNMNSASDGIAVKEGGTTAYIPQGLWDEGDEDGLWRGISAAASDTPVMKATWTISGSNSKSGKNMAVGVIPEGPWWVTHMGTTTSPWSAMLNLTTSWGMIWCPGGAVYECGSGDNSPIFMTPKWPPGATLSVAVDKVTSIISFSIDHEQVYVAACTGTARYTLTLAAFIKERSITISLSPPKVRDAPKLCLTDVKHTPQVFISSDAWNHRLEKEAQIGLMVPFTRNKPRFNVRRPQSGIILRTPVESMHAAMACPDAYSMTDETYDARQARKLYRQWALGWETKVAPFPWAEAVMREMEEVTKGLKRPNALSTATSCMMIFRMVPLYSGLVKILRRCLPVLFSAIYHDFEDETIMELDLTGDGNLPQFISMRPWSGKANTTEVEPSAAKKESVSFFQDEGVDVDSLSEAELRKYARSLEEEVAELKKSSLKVHFNAWRQRNVVKTEGWDYLLVKAKDIVLVGKFFDKWKKKFKDHRDRRYEIEMERALLSNNTHGRSKSSVVNIVNTTAGWAALAESNTNTGESEAPKDDALEGGSSKVEGINVEELLLQWIETVQVAAETGFVYKPKNFTFDFRDGQALLSVCRCLAPNQLDANTTNPLKELDIYFSQTPLPDMIYNTDYLTDCCNAMNVLCVASLLTNWLREARTNESNVILSLAFSKFAEVIDVPIESSAWVHLTEKIRTRCMDLLVSERTGLMYPFFKPLLKGHSEGLLKRALMSIDVRRVCASNCVARFLKVAFKRAAQEDEEITLHEFRDLLNLFGWVPSPVSLQDLHLVFFLCQGGSSPDATGSDGDGTIDSEEFIDAFSILSAFFIDNPNTGCSAAEHLEWFYHEHVIPRAESAGYT